MVYRLSVSPGRWEDGPNFSSLKSPFMKTFYNSETYRVRQRLSIWSKHNKGIQPQLLSSLRLIQSLRPLQSDLWKSRPQLRTLLTCTSREVCMSSKLSRKNTFASRKWKWKWNRAICNNLLIFLVSTATGADFMINQKSIQKYWNKHYFGSQTRRHRSNFRSFTVLLPHGQEGQNSFTSWTK